MPRLTVALPVFNSKDIVWLAMESLCRQQSVNFDWELIVCEENTGQYAGESFFKQYEERLNTVGCARLHYIKLDKWMPLPMKWRLMAREASPDSQFYVLQAADCYSFPMRLSRTMGVLSDGRHDWYQTLCGYFYHIFQDKIIKYNHATLGANYQRKTALNMATLTRHIKALPDCGRLKGIDGWILSTIRNPKIYNDLAKGWSKGVDSHGLNNISKGRGDRFKEIKPPFQRALVGIKDVVPADICDRLNNIRSEYSKHYIKRIPTSILAHALMDYTLYLRGADHLKHGTSGLREIVKQYIEDANNRYGYPGETVNIAGQCKCGSPQSYREHSNMKVAICPACLKEKYLP